MGYVKALHGLGDVLREQGNRTESREILLRAVALIDTHGRTHQPAYRGLLGRVERSLSLTE